MLNRLLLSLLSECAWNSSWHKINSIRWEPKFQKLTVPFLNLACTLMNSLKTCIAALNWRMHQKLSQRNLTRAHVNTETPGRHWFSLMKLLVEFNLLIPQVLHLPSWYLKLMKLCFHAGWMITEPWKRTPCLIHTLCHASMTSWHVEIRTSFTFHYTNIYPHSFISFYIWLLTLLSRHIIWIILLLWSHLLTRSWDSILFNPLLHLYSTWQTAPRVKSRVS